MKNIIVLLIFFVYSYYWKFWEVFSNKFLLNSVCFLLYFIFKNNRRNLNFLQNSTLTFSRSSFKRSGCLFAIYRYFIFPSFLNLLFGFLKLLKFGYNYKFSKKMYWKLYFEKKVKRYVIIIFEFFKFLRIS